VRGRNHARKPPKRHDELVRRYNDGFGHPLCHPGTIVLSVPRARNRRVLFKRALIAPLASQRDLCENYDTKTEIEIRNSKPDEKNFLFPRGFRACTHAYRTETTLPLFSAYFRTIFPHFRYNKSRARKREALSHPPPPLVDASPKPLALARVPAKQRRETDRRLM